MECHPYFDLWLHSNQDLSEYLKNEVMDRVTLHEWPLSCVQRLLLADGDQWIYKSQLRATTVEPEFYAAVKGFHISPYLPKAKYIGNLHYSVGMVFEYISAPCLTDLQLSESQIVDYGKILLSIIHPYPVELNSMSSVPVYTDISSLVKWSAYAAKSLSMLNDLITKQQFCFTTSADVRGLTEWSQSQAVSQLFQSPATLNHGDLGGDNIFVTQDGFKIIDWQRPILGPAELDLVTYLYAMGVDPLKYTPRSINELNWFIHMHWFVECKAYWFPPGESYDRQVAELTHLILHKV